MPSSVRRLTALDHERLHRLLRRMCAPGPSQDRWRAEFGGLLRAHRVAERDAVTAAAVTRIEPAEEDELDGLAERVRQADLRVADLDGLRDRGDRLLVAHAERWSASVIAPLERAVARGELRRLGGTYQKRRDAELAVAGVVHAPPRRLDVSRAELYELARKAGIEGRSAMTRGQLITELQRHGG